LWDSLPQAKSLGHCYTDFGDTYQTVILKNQHTAMGKETGETAHIERFNNTLRQRLGRFVRKTLSFSRINFYALYMSESLSPSLQLGEG